MMKVIAALLISTAFAAEPFGLNTLPSQDTNLIKLWHNLRLDIANDEFIIALCRSDPTCGSAAAVRFIAIVDAAKTHTDRAMLGHLNQAIKHAIIRTRNSVP